LIHKWIRKCSVFFFFSRKPFSLRKFVVLHICTCIIL
jgi:hypothetical protein